MCRGRNLVLKDVMMEHSALIYNRGMTAFRATCVRTTTLLGKVKSFVGEHVGQFFYIGLTLLALGTCFSIAPGIREWCRGNMYYFPPALLVIGGLFTWTAMYYWIDLHSQLTAQSTDHPPHVVFMDEPPQYSSLPGALPDLSKVAPPAYEDICHTTDTQAESQYSNAASISVTVCPVHQPLSNTRQEEIGLTRCRSLGDLC